MIKPSNYPDNFSVVYHDKGLAYQATINIFNDVMMSGNKKMLGFASDYPECHRTMKGNIIWQK